jgi:ABC-type hemin transport system substrate-binding protein
VTLEEVVERDPQVVLLPSEPYRFRHRHLPEIEALPVSAVRDGRVHLVDGRLLCWYGPRIPEGLTQVRRLLEGE